jgi:hypothetical protein
MLMDVIERNRNLGLAINRDIWNDRRFELIPDYFSEDAICGSPVASSSRPG